MIITEYLYKCNYYHLAGSGLTPERVASVVWEAYLSAGQLLSLPSVPGEFRKGYGGALILGDLDCDATYTNELGMQYDVASMLDWLITQAGWYVEANTIAGLQNQSPNYHNINFRVVAPYGDYNSIGIGAGSGQYIFSEGRVIEQQTFDGTNNINRLLEIGFTEKRLVFWNSGSNSIQISAENINLSSYKQNYFIPSASGNGSMYYRKYNSDGNVIAEGPWGYNVTVDPNDDILLYNALTSGPTTTYTPTLSNKTVTEILVGGDYSGDNNINYPPLFI